MTCGVLEWLMLKVSFSSNVNTVCILPRVLVNPFHHGFQLLHWATLIKLCDTILNHVLNTLLPQYWGCNLRCQVIVDLPWIGAHPLSDTADIHVQVYFGEI